jgi:hypothetical protein
MISRSDEKLPFYVETYPDELWYSILGRLYGRLKWPRSSFCKTLYGRASLPTPVCFPSNFERFVSASPGYLKLEARDLIEAHTLLPLYRPFVRSNRYEELVSRLVRPGRLGGVRFKIFGPLKYCPQCAAQDRAFHIPPYWRRSHQAYGVQVCHIHSSVLRPQPVGLAPHLASPIPVPETALVERRSLAPELLELEIDYSRLCREILDPQGDVKDGNALVQHYSSALSKPGRPLKQLIGQIAKSLQQPLYRTFIRNCDITKIYPLKIAACLHCSFTEIDPRAHFLISRVCELDLRQFIFGPKQISPSSSNRRFWKLQTDWKNRDEKAYPAMMRLVEEERKRAHPKPIRHSRKFWMKKLGIYCHNIDRLPRTRKIIEENTETMAEFKIRTLEWIGNNYSATLRYPRGYRAFERLMIRKFRFINNDVRAAIVKAWETILARRGSDLAQSRKNS